LNIMRLASPQSAILAAVLFNALVIVALIPLALRGVRYRPSNAAELQAPRVAGERGLDRARVERLIQEHTTGRALGFMGEPAVRVLELNLALDKA